MKELIIVAHNIRSTHNVGSIFRTAEGFGVSKVLLSGYTPYPKLKEDSRLPHIADKLHDQIHKTALGAEDMVKFSHQENLDLSSLRQEGFTLVALEKCDGSTNIRSYTPPEKVALIIGEEVHGIDRAILDECDEILEIPMQGKKESFNVSVATGIALYALTST